jgi:hypothetical protein
VVVEGFATFVSMEGRSGNFVWSLPAAGFRELKPAAGHPAVVLARLPPELNAEVAAVERDATLWSVVVARRRIINPRRVDDRRGIVNRRPVVIGARWVVIVVVMIVAPTGKLNRWSVRISG